MAKTWFKIARGAMAGEVVCACLSFGQYLMGMPYICRNSDYRMTDSRMTEKDFLPASYSGVTSENWPGKLKASQSIAEGTTAWRSPSNIALVKYWGKKDNQIPANPSVSFTLNNSATETRVTYRKRDAGPPAFSFELLFEGRPKPDFRPKIETFLQRIERYLPFLRDLHLTIATSNSFPHSSGIASSASGMSALALCLMGIERKLTPQMDNGFFAKKASFLARLGSGSACRSIEGPLVAWGNHPALDGSSDLYGIPYPYKTHEIFKGFQDTILLVDQGKKQVSSTAGHGLMHGHPFAEKRFAQASQNLSGLLPVLENGDLNGFIKILESEALSLHAMMMTGHPYFILMKPNTLEIINKIWAFREASRANVCFTLDAGANVHVLYPAEEKEKVYAFIESELLRYCENGGHILDNVGTGAKKMLNSH